MVVEELIPEMSQEQHSNVGTVFLRGGLQRDGAGCGTGVMTWDSEKCLNSLTEETAGRIVLAEGPLRSGFL